MDSNSENIKLSKEKRYARIKRTLDLIEGANKSINLSDDPSIRKQYQHLKKDYTQQLLELLKVYDLPVNFTFTEAA